MAIKKKALLLVDISVLVIVRRGRRRISSTTTFCGKFDKHQFYQLMIHIMQLAFYLTCARDVPADSSLLTLFWRQSSRKSVEIFAIIDEHHDDNDNNNNNDDEQYLMMNDDGRFNSLRDAVVVY